MLGLQEGQVVRREPIDGPLGGKDLVDHPDLAGLLHFGPLDGAHPVAHARGGGDQPFSLKQVQGFPDGRAGDPDGLGQGRLYQPLARPDPSFQDGGAESVVHARTDGLGSLDDEIVENACVGSICHGVIAPCRRTRCQPLPARMTRTSP